MDPSLCYKASMGGATQVTLATQFQIIVGQERTRRQETNSKHACQRQKGGEEARKELLLNARMAAVLVGLRALVKAARPWRRKPGQNPVHPRGP
jgi:hypothetical protein